MKTTDVHQVYDSQYAATYDERFLLRPETKVDVEFELGIIQKLLAADSQWLDIGCGTGYFLSQFPGVARAGFDLSPSMLVRAAAASPDALFFRQGDFRLPVPEWQSHWSLVSCMWAAYSYVESVQEVEQVVANMVAWTQPGGTIFIPVIDLEILRQVAVTYYEEAALFGGHLAVTSCNWTWTEADTGKTHEHLVAPHTEHFVKLLAPYFDNITVVRYPPKTSYLNPRRAVIATGRRAHPDAARPAVTTWPEPLPAPGAWQLSAAALSHRELLAEVGSRLRPNRLWHSLQRRLFA